MTVPLTTDNLDTVEMFNSLKASVPYNLVLKPAATLGFGPSSVRRYGEPARRTGRVLPSPDSSLVSFSLHPYSAQGVYTVSLGHLSQEDSLSLSDVTYPFHRRFESASPQSVSGDCPLTVRYSRTTQHRLV